jgi:hypothetical protein
MKKRKKLRYNGNILRRAKRTRLFYKFMDEISAKIRARLTLGLPGPWNNLHPENTPEPTGPVLTKLVFDQAAESLEIKHP